MSLLALLRHGQDTSADRSGGPVDAPADRPLTAIGRAQAAATRDFLATMDAEEVVTSAAPRAVETARIIAGDRPVRIEATLGGWDLGDWRAQTLRELSGIAELLDHPDTRPPAGESLSELQRRVRDAFRVLRQSSRDLIIVSHRMFNAVLLADVLGLPLSMSGLIQQDHGAVNVMQYDGDWVRVAMLNVNPYDPLRGGVSTSGRV